MLADCVGSVGRARGPCGLPSTKARDSENSCILLVFPWPTGRSFASCIVVPAGSRRKRMHVRCRPRPAGRIGSATAAVGALSAARARARPARRARARSRTPCERARRARARGRDGRPAAAGSAGAGAPAHGRARLPRRPARPAPRRYRSRSIPRSRQSRARSARCPTRRASRLSSANSRAYRASSSRPSARQLGDRLLDLCSLAIARAPVARGPRPPSARDGRGSAVQTRRPARA